MIRTIGSLERPSSVLLLRDILWGARAMFWQKNIIHPNRKPFRNPLLLEPEHCSDTRISVLLTENPFLVHRTHPRCPSNNSVSQNANVFIKGHRNTTVYELGWAVLWNRTTDIARIPALSPLSHNGYEISESLYSRQIEHRLSKTITEHGGPSASPYCSEEYRKNKWYLLKITVVLTRIPVLKVC